MVRVAIIGGTGFVGSYVAAALLAEGCAVRSLVRPGSEGKLPPGAEPVTGTLADTAALDALFRDCDAWVYSVGILREAPRRGITFAALQYEGLVHCADAARRHAASRAILISANGVKRGGTPYQETKWQAEEFLLSEFPDATVLQPSVIFGDPAGRMEIATQLCRDMVAMPLPAMDFRQGLLPGSGDVVMSPVHVSDVAEIVMRLVRDGAHRGERLPLGGPEVLSWGEMIRRVATAAGRSKRLIPMPLPLMRLSASLFEWVPGFPVTADQLRMLAEGNTADPAAAAAILGRQPLRFAAGQLAYLANPE